MDNWGAARIADGLQAIAKSLKQPKAEELNDGNTSDKVLAAFKSLMELTREERLRVIAAVTAFSQDTFK